MSCPKKIFTLVFAVFLISQNVSAQVVFNEIMYDLKVGSDDGREWVEIVNNGNESVQIATSTWKFFEANTNHSLSLFQGNLLIPVGGFAIIADDPSKFLLDWPGFSGTIFDSSFSLSNTGETVAIKSSTTTTVDQVTYTSSTGASGDGNSLQFIDGVFKAQSPTPGLANSNGGSFATSSNQAENSSSSSTTTTSANSSANDSASANGSNNSNWPVEPQIFSRIIGPSTAINGADIILKGEAIGLDKQPLPNARYIWNFGDGATKEGESVLHSYNFPGEYMVILDVSSGKYSAGSRLKIKIIPADIVISAVITGPEGKIEILNNSGYELNLSSWLLSSGGKFFTLPKNTIILPHARLPFSFFVTGFLGDPLDTALLYPNGMLAYRYELKEASPLAIVTSPVSSPRSIEAPNISASKNNEQKINQQKKISISPQDAEVSKPVENVLQTASVEKSISAVSEGEKPRPAENNRFNSVWLYALLGVILLASFLAFAAKPSPPKNLADEIKIIED